MKILLAIWAVAIITGLVAVNYVNAQINDLVAQNKPVNLERTVVTGNLQGSSPNLQATATDWQVQPAATLYQIQPQTGGNGQDYELQPALGYGALNHTTLQ